MVEQQQRGADRQRLWEDPDGVDWTAVGREQRSFAPRDEEPKEGELNRWPPKGA